MQFVPQFKNRSQSMLKNTTFDSRRSIKNVAQEFKFETASFASFKFVSFTACSLFYEATLCCMTYVIVALAKTILARSSSLSWSRQTFKVYEDQSRSKFACDFVEL